MLGLIKRGDLAREPLTERQLEIWEHIIVHYHNAGHPPTVREIGAAAGISSPNGVAGVLKVLAKKGWIQLPPASGHNGAKSRGIVVPEIRDAIRAAAVALMEGT